MATQFSVNEDRCERFGCQAASGVTYYVTEKKCLCEKCARKNGCIKKGRKGDIGLFCKKHDNPVKLYCQDHELPVCQICAIKDHQKPCQLDDVPVVLEQKRKELLTLRPTLNDQQRSWKTYNGKVSESMKKCEAHLKSIEKAVNNAKDDQMAQSRKEKQEAAKLINDEADEEIRKINEKRDEQLKQCHQDAEKRQQDIKTRQLKLLDDVKAKAEPELLDLQRDARVLLQAIDEATKKMEILLEDDKELLKGAHKLIASLNDTLQKTADEGVVKRITQRVKRVSFIGGRVREPIWYPPGHSLRLGKTHTGK